MKIQRSEIFILFTLALVALSSWGCDPIGFLTNEECEGYIYASENEVGFGVGEATPNGFKQVLHHRLKLAGAVASVTGRIDYDSSHKPIGAYIYKESPDAEGKPELARIEIHYDPVSGAFSSDPPVAQGKFNSRGYHPLGYSGNQDHDAFSPAEVQAAPNGIYAYGPPSGPKNNDLVRWNLNTANNVTGINVPVVAIPGNETLLGGNISRDGGAAVALSGASGATTWNLRIQRLNNGKRAGSPVTIKVPQFSGYSPDITNPIDTGAITAAGTKALVRYVVYREFKNAGQPTQQSRILIQTTDSATGQPIGPPRALTNFAKAFLGGLEAASSLAISPYGRYLIYTVYNNGCKKQIILVLLLNQATGTKDSAPKVAVACNKLPKGLGAYGLDCDTIEPPAN